MPRRATEPTLIRLSIAATALSALVWVPSGVILGAQVECRVVSESADGLYVDAGSDSGIAAGATGVVERGGAEVARVEVLEVAPRSALVRILHGRGSEGPRAGDRVVIDAEAPASGSAAGSSASPRDGEKASDDVGEEFVPLLAPPRRAVGFPSTSNIFHGRLGVRQLFQIDSEGSLDYSLTSLDSDGSLDRIGGTPWALQWSGRLSYRALEAFEESSYYEKPRLDVFRLYGFRKFEDGGFVRAGRFLPSELPSVGYIDGVQAETPVSGALRLGAVAGLKPDREDLAPSVQEPTAVGYAALESGKRRDLYYAGTAGLLGSLYEGKFDRLALLFDQRADITAYLSLFSTVTVDFPTGAQEYREGVRLTHLDLYASSPVTSWLTLRAGLDHYEVPDTRAVRDLYPTGDGRYFDSGYWRYWLGGTQYLPWRLRLDEEIAFIDDPDYEYAPHWRVSLTRTGLFSLEGMQVTLTVYNLDGADAEGYGGLLVAYVPMLEGRLFLRPSVGFRFLETNLTAREFDITDVSAYADWWISRNWRLSAGASFTFGEVLGATLVDVGLEYRW